jgi:hypothetical protein
MTRLSIASLILSLTCLAATPVAAQTPAPAVPRMIQFAGQVLTATGEPRIGNVLLTFGVYEDQTGGPALWTEQHLVTLTATGRYAVLLGSLSSDGLRADLFVTGSAKWLGVQVEAEPELPRAILVSVPYALKAADADTVAGRPITDFILANSGNGGVKTTSSAAANGGNPTTQGGTQNRHCFFGLGGVCDQDSIAREINNMIGINVTPAATLDVNGDVNLANGSNLRFGYNGIFTRDAVNGFYQLGGGANDYLKIYAGGNEQARLTTAGNFGLGTTAPDRKLVVRDSNAVIGLYNSGAGQTSDILFANSGGSTVGYIEHNNNTSLMSVINTANGALRFGTASAEVIRIASDGSVGIGTSSPTSKLHVVGTAHITSDITVDGNIAAKYQDVAEWVETSETIEAGTVVIVDPKEPNRVIPSPRAYDTRVAGAVSAQPGLTLGVRGDNKAMVAQSGRVRIKADAKYGAIKIGDLLVTSPTPGYAMRSRPMKIAGQSLHRPGTLLGKALEALPNGKGEILVLLTLQ